MYLSQFTCVEVDLSEIKLNYIQFHFNPRGLRLIHMYSNEPVLGKENAAIHHPSQMNLRMFVGFDCEVNHFIFFFLTLSDSVSVPVCLVWLHTCVCLLLFCPNTFGSSAHMHELNYRLELCHDSLFSLNKKILKSFA